MKSLINVSSLKSENCASWTDIKNLSEFLFSQLRLGVPHTAAWLCFSCTFYKVISFLAPNFDLLCVFLWDAQITPLSV